MTDILPTGHCFDDALDYISERCKRNPSIAPALRLVHAICVATNGTRYAHAWAEEADLCWDCGLVDGVRLWYGVKRDDFYAARRVAEHTSYTVLEAIQENTKAGHYGPWEQLYLDHVRTGEAPLAIMGSMQITAAPRTVTTFDELKGEPGHGEEC